MLLPESRGQLGDARTGMLADPLPDIDQVVIRIDVVEATSGQQTLHDADVFSPEFCPWGVSPNRRNFRLPRNLMKNNLYALDDR